MAELLTVKSGFLREILPPLSSAERAERLTLIADILTALILLLPDLYTEDDGLMDLGGRLEEARACVERRVQ